MNVVGRRQDRKPCPHCQLDKPWLESGTLSGAWRCTGCGLRGPFSDQTGHKWDSLPRRDPDSANVQMTERNDGPSTPKPQIVPRGQG